MKQETKELVDWMKNCFLNIPVLIPKENLESDFAERRERAINFLNSIPDIEKKLCFGGYIQDKNGTPCCHGDKIINNGKVGTLYWSKLDFRFLCKQQNNGVNKDKVVFYYLNEDFEKIGLFKAGE